jgi:hypothetical protein
MPADAPNGKPAGALGPAEHDADHRRYPTPRFMSGDFSMPGACR